MEEVQFIAEIAKTKNLRAALPRGDAEDLIGNRSSDAECREPRTRCSQWDART
jgi:hypothetical protein